MRLARVLIPACMAALFAHGALAQPQPGSCEAKRADISRDIEEAKSRNQAQRLRGLETALREVQANCSDAQLQNEHRARMARQERKVAERQRDLDQARRQGKPDKIASREAKLAEEQATLQNLRSGER